jgi:hypothetical protein
MKCRVATSTLSAVVGLCAGIAIAAPALADDAKPPAPPPAWSDTIKFSGYVEASIMGNLGNPADGINWGRLYDDRANTPLLNQASLILTRPTNPNAPGYDFGFTLQGLYGSDARYTHFVGELDRVTAARYQFDIIEADVLMHLPLVTAGGVEVKLGQFPTLLSAEVIPPASNPLFSHSYIYNFGVPVKHTGLWTVTHANSTLDVWLGLDTGNQTSFSDGDNNSDSLAGLVGMGLNLLDGRLTTLWLTHFGPENPIAAGENFNVNSAFRYETTVTTVWKYSDALTLTTDLNWIRDTGFQVDGYGVAQYAAYAIDDRFTLQARGEVWRDAQGFFVAAFPGSLDADKAFQGQANGAIHGPATTYAEVTLGVNYRPPVPALFTGAVFRPEIRYDTTTDGARPFEAGTSNHQFTIGGDFVLPF